MTLSPHQSEIMRFVARGMLNKEIAVKLGVSERHVKNNTTAIFKKLGVRNRIEAIARLYGIPGGEARLEARDSTSPTLVSGTKP